MQKNKNVPLSASRIKLLQSCSWKYWCTYHLNLPRSGNDGSARGTACHLVLEVLLRKDRKKYIKKIISKEDAYYVKSIKRLVEKSLRKSGFLSEENVDMCNDMILVGLHCNFLGGKNATIKEPEKEFLIENDDPKYTIYGFMDKPVEYPKEKRIKIVDYKTSKSKFCEAEVEHNVQALCYLLASKSIWPHLKKKSVEFQFLKFPDNPSIEIEVTDEELEGFEYYLEHIFGIVNNFNESYAESNLAARQKFPKKREGFTGPLNCGFAKYPKQKKKDGTLMWHCDYKFPFDYYAVVDKNGKVISSSLTKKDLKKVQGCKIEKKHYDGCPAFKSYIHDAPKDSNIESEKNDDFDF